jgi:hypothetical protein
MTTPILGMTEMTEGQSAKHTLFNTNIRALESGTIVKLADGVTSDMQNGDGKTNLFTVPTGKKAVVTMVVVRNATASLAGGTDFDFGDGANADTWKQTVDLSGMTGTSSYMVIRNDSTIITVFDATDVFGVKPATGATADAQASIDVFGYIYDA